jgi:hypothetical protein
VPHRIYGSVDALYRNDGGEVQGSTFRSTYLDRRVDLGVGGSLLGPRLGRYSLNGGMGWLRQQGGGPATDDARGRFDARVQLLPEAPVNLTGFVSRGRTSVPADGLRSTSSDGVGGGVGARLLPRSNSSFDVEDLADRFGPFRNSARSLRAHHAQSLVLGPHQFNATGDWLDQRDVAGRALLETRTRRGTGRLDGHVALRRLGPLNAWFQLDREQARSRRGPLPDRDHDNIATNADLTTPLGKRSSLRQSWADQSFRDETGGLRQALRLQVVEQRLDARSRVAATRDLHTVVRSQFSHLRGQADLWMVTALGELEPARAGAFTLVPRLGLNAYSGGLGDGRHAGEIAGVTLRLAGRDRSFELMASRERTKGTGLRARLDGGAYAAWSPRQVGAQLIHALHSAASLASGPFAFTVDHEYQRIENTSLGLDMSLQRVHGSVGLHAGERVAFDLSVDHATTDRDAVVFSDRYRSTSGSLGVTLRPRATLELRSRGTIGRVPSGPREEFWRIDDQIAWHLPQLDLSLHHLVDHHTDRVRVLFQDRTQRLLEMRATRRFQGWL